MKLGQQVTWVFLGCVLSAEVMSERCGAKMVGFRTGGAGVGALQIS
jgi:hypothetical protein